MPGGQTGGTVERELFATLYRLLRQLARQRPRRKRTRVGDAIIAAVFFWAVLHDRPVVWATRRWNWPRDQLDFELPAQSTMSRRLRSDGVRELLAALHDLLRGEAQATLVKMMDAKPLPVGAYSVARDARWGQGVRGKVRGYKLHALYGQGPLPIAWEVVREGLRPARPMNASEQRVGRRLLSHLRTGGYVLADSVYDVNPLHGQAAASNHQLLTPRKRPDAGLGHRTHHPARLRSIERRFGRLTNFGGGLAPLPNWVRTLRRVRLWVGAKLLIDALRWHGKARLVA